MLLVLALLSFGSLVSANVFPNIPLNFTATVGVLHFTGSMTLIVRSGSLRYDPVMTHTLIKLSPFIFAPEGDYYLTTEQTQSNSLAFLYIRATGVCQALDGQGNAAIPWFSLSSFAWLNSASYSGQSEAGSPFGTDCGMFQTAIPSPFGNQARTESTTPPASGQSAPLGLLGVYVALLHREVALSRCSMVTMVSLRVTCFHTPILKMQAESYCSCPLHATTPRLIHC
jgi:hypothetical protein